MPSLWLSLVFSVWCQTSVDAQDSNDEGGAYLLTTGPLPLATSATTAINTGTVPTTATGLGISRLTSGEQSTDAGDSTASGGEPIHASQTWTVGHTTTSGGQPQPTNTEHTTSSTATTTGALKPPLQTTGTEKGNEVKNGTELRILPVGDSITVGYEDPQRRGYRLELLKDLSGQNLFLFLNLQSII